MISVRVTAADGVALALHRLDAEAQGRQAVMLVHGAFTSHRVWIRQGGLAAYLARRGFDVWLADLRHHGASEREPRRGVWRFEDLILSDAPALVARVRDAVRRPPALVGHSIGGVVGLSWLARAAPPAALAALVTLGTPGPSRFGLVTRALAAATARLSDGLGRFPARWLRLGPEDECGRVFADWMRWNASGRWTGRDGFDYLGALAGVRTPYLGVAGEGDRFFAPVRCCREIVERVGAASRDLMVCGPRLGHAGLVLDPRAAEHCWPQLADWLERTCPVR